MLYVVSTPIGNLRDITFRAVDVLKNCDLVIAENPSHTARLLKTYDIAKPTKQFADHNEQRVLGSLVKECKEKNACLVSDAGTPGVSDPGFRLIRECIKEGIEIDVIPGVSSVIAALTLSGLPSDRFLFVGFLPKTEIKLYRIIELIEATDSTLIAFESPQRLKKTIALLENKFPAYNIAIARELTKLHQEVIRASIAECSKQISKRQSIKGEIVLVISKKK